MVGVAVAFRAQSRADRVDDRKLSHGVAMATDATVPLHNPWPEAGGLHKRVGLLKRPERCQYPVLHSDFAK